MTLQLNVGGQNSKPIYKQIVQYFEEMILNGDLDAGAPLPTERDLAVQLGVNRSTITTAYAELRASGLVYSKQGSGTRVSHNAWDLLPQRFVNWSNVRNVSFAPMLPIAKRILEVTSNQDVINLATGRLSNDLYPQDSYKLLMQQILKNTDLTRVDEQELKKALASHFFADQDIVAEPYELLTTSGIQQAILLLIHCLLSPGDSVAIECPSYTYTNKLFTSAGVKMVRLPIDKQGIKPEEIYELYNRHRIKMVITNPTYQNPTGTTLTIERRKKLLEICSDLHVPIIEIDCFSTLSYNGDQPPSLYSLNKTKGLVIQIGNITEALGPELDIGWLLASKNLIERFEDAKYQMGLGASSFTEKIASELLLSGYWRDNRTDLQENLTRRKDITLSALKQYAGNSLTFIEPEGGFYLWCKLNGMTREKDLLETLIQHGVVAVPGGIYGVDKGFIRLSFAHCEEERINEGVKRLCNAIGETKHKLYSDSID
ncbi:PLP-dependent aminotransferase family protein [Pseudalkalibacillus caeni]|uniref:PLP-dependent aminotransferase family protein n=1 Tax=Exobacillus caeni TaxID=2574798 RepID=A0A5R9FBI7_9BACL|nr:PLP-dependent aminotransferase family protein [Pseudalkalibacillus caeni]TLS38253.1 PLP-dependent aminotransferase family protein [Pseudalkalibacillus caeni]